MRNGLVAGLALGAALLAASGAYAFQEQQGNTAPAAPQAQPQQAPAEGASDAKQLGLSDETAKKGEAGTEIRIPGLGKLGVLPKMDFGLELLYGAADQKPAGPPENAPNPDDDLQIRGTVKHRF